MSRIFDILLQHEGCVLKVYDDATGRQITPETHVIGHPTIGIGRALDVNGITRDEAMYLLENDVAKVRQQAEKSFPWFTGLNEARQDVVLSMIFNVGLGCFKAFKRTIAAIEASDYTTAAIEMKSSIWAKQVGKRAEALSRMMETGSYQDF